MGTCRIHPGLQAAATINGVDVCAQCQGQIEAAVKKVDKHVEPKGCLVWYEGGKTGWQPIPGTGCAHWVAHQRGIKRGSAGEQCMLGYPFRVSTTIGGTSLVKKIEDVKAGDFYVADDGSHMGIVCKVTPNAKEPGKPAILIRHDSSKLGKVSESDYAGYFKGKGVFRR